MSDVSKIEWCDATWNVVTGCTKIAPECANCYIDRTPPFRMAGRKFVHGKIPLILHEDRLDKPLHWRKPKRIFVNSLSDLFHEDVPDSFILSVFDTMNKCTWSGGQNCGKIGGSGHTFQLLTKRAGRMRDFMLRLRWTGEQLVLDKAIPGGLHSMLQQIWLGTSVGVAKRKGEIDLLRETPAAVRFLSIEPLLEDLGELDLTGIHWVIVGGESGAGARPMQVEWARSIVQQCKAAGVACFVKQLGTVVRDRELSNWPDSPPHGQRINLVGDGFGNHSVTGLRDRKGGDMDEWPDDLRVREFPAK